MEFTNLFSPVHLEEDPSIGSNGQLYFNTASSVYRVFYDSQWNSLAGIEDIPQPQAFVFGDRGLAVFNFSLQPEHINNTVVLLSASANIVSIQNTTLDSYPLGTYMDFIRGGPGTVSFTPEEGVTLNKPDDVYLTAVWQSVRLTKINDNEWVLSGEFPDIY